MLKLKKSLTGIYKKIIYFIFKIIYGKIQKSIDANQVSDLQIEKVLIDKNNYLIYFCNKTKLYTDRIHDTAVIKEDMIIDGPSFQYRDNKNVDCKQNIVFSKGTPRIKRKINGRIFSLLTGGGGNTNYWHWLLDVLPRLAILEKVNSDHSNIDYYLFPNLDEQFQNESLDLLNISKEKRLSSKDFRHIFADQIIVTSHPYNILNDPLSDSLNIPGWILTYLKNNFLNGNLKENNSKLPRRIYINRKDGRSHRFIINESEVLKVLKKHDFVSITLSNYSLSDQIQLFKNAEYVAGLHGAGFVNTIFCSPGTKVLEFKSSTAGDAIKNIVLQNKLFYKDLSSENKTFKYNNQYGDIEIDIDLLKSILN